MQEQERRFTFGNIVKAITLLAFIIGLIWFECTVAKTHQISSKSWALFVGFLAYLYTFSFAAIGILIPIASYKEEDKIYKRIFGCFSTVVLCGAVLIQILFWGMVLQKDEIFKFSTICILIALFPSIYLIMCCLKTTNK